MCSEAVHNHPYTLEYVPDKLKTQEMCESAVEKSPRCLKYVPDHFKTEKMCVKAFKKETEALEHVPDHFKTGGRCKRAIEADLCTLVFCPDWFVTQEQIKSWYDDDYDDEAPGLSKTQGSKRLLKRRALTYCLASIKVLGLVYIRRQNKRDRKIFWPLDMLRLKMY